MTWSDGGRDTDQRWVLKREPRDPHGFLSLTPRPVLVLGAVVVVALTVVVAIVVMG